MALTFELSVAGSDVDVARAVRSCSILFEELQVRECGGIDSCRFISLVTSVKEHSCKTPTSLLKRNGQSRGEEQQDGASQLDRKGKGHHRRRVLSAQ